MRHINSFLLLLLVAATGIFAVPFYGNQSNLIWKSAETDNFRFHYPLEYQGQAEQIVSFAEAIHDSVESRYRIKLPGRVNMVIRNSLFSNGLASPISNTMNVWLTDWDFKVRSTHPWMNDVVTHEFSHLVSIQSGSKFAPFLHGLQFSWQDYYNEPVQTSSTIVYPFSIYPLWFAEGTAQYESARMGFDAWDTHRDMLFRVAILGDSLLPLQQMEDFPDNGLGSELGPYNQGFNLVLYISQRFGDKAIPNLWSEMSRLHRVSFDAACRAVLGIPQEQLLREWKQDRLEQYTRERARIGTERAGLKRSKEAFWQDFPQVVNGALYGVSNMGGPWFDGSLFKLPLKDTLTEEQKPDSLGAYSMASFSKTPFHLTKPWLDKGFSIRARSNESPLIAYVSYQNRDRSGRAYFDIAIDDTSASPWFGERRSLRFATKFVDAVYPDISPNASEVVFVRREQGGARFALSKARIPEQGLGPEDYQDLMTAPDSASIFGIYSPKWSPDGKQIAFSYYDGISRKVAVIGADGKGFRIIAAGNSDNRDPVWSTDGTSLIYSSDRSGVFNLYKQSVKVQSPPTLVAPAPPVTPATAGASTTLVTDSTGTVLAAQTIAQATPQPTEQPTTQQVAQPATEPVAQPATPVSPVAPTPPAPFIDSSLIATPLTNVLGGAFAPVVDSARIWYIGYDLDGFSLYELPLQDSAVQVTPGPRLAAQPRNLSIGAIELAAVERPYRPLPNQPILVPLLSIEDRADDLGSIRHGIPVAKAGFALGLSDPLQKNYLQLALLLELGKGYEFINTSGLNPALQSDFFVMGENRSFPITLGLGYVRKNVTTSDTVRYEDPRSYGDSIGISHMAIGSQALEGSAGYSVWKQGDSLMVGAGASWSNFNLYEDGFDWDYYKNIHASAAALYQTGVDETGSAMLGEGNGAMLSYTGAKSWLFRPGSFQESFTVNAQGVISPTYRQYITHEAWLSLWYGIANPVHPGARLVASAQASGILNWSGQSSHTDTLDHFYHHALVMAGYPVLADKENLVFHGDRTSMLQLHYLFPIYSDWNGSWWIFTAKSMGIDLFAQAGTAWYDQTNFHSQVLERANWKRSLGLEFRWSNRIFMNQPMDIWLNLARGLNRIQTKQGREELSTVDIPLLPSKISPTTVSFGLGFQFSDPWRGATANSPQSSKQLSARR